MCGQQLCRDLTPVYIYDAVLQGSRHGRGHVTPSLSLVQAGHGFTTPLRRRGQSGEGLLSASSPLSRGPRSQRPTPDCRLQHSDSRTCGWLMWPDPGPSHGGSWLCPLLLCGNLIYSLQDQGKSLNLLEGQEVWAKPIPQPPPPPPPAKGKEVKCLFSLSSKLAHKL